MVTRMVMDRRSRRLRPLTWKWRNFSGLGVFSAATVPFAGHPSMGSVFTVSPRNSTAVLALLAGMFVACGCRTTSDSEAPMVGQVKKSASVLARQMAMRESIPGEPMVAGQKSTDSPNDVTCCEPIPNVIGTAFVVHEDGFAITCSHVLRGRGTLVAGRLDEQFAIEVIATDELHDLALIRIKSSGKLKPLNFTRVEEAFPGQRVFTIGYPITAILGLSPKLTEGIINSRRGLRDKPSEYQTSVTIQPGNSGGALFDPVGNVVGMITSRLDDLAVLNYSGIIPQSVNYAVKSHVILDFLHLNEIASNLDSDSPIRPLADLKETVEMIELASFYLYAEIPQD